MITERKTNLDIKLEGQAWMTVANPALSMPAAVEKLQALGNVILEVDEENRRILCMDVSQYPFEYIYICEKCGSYSIREAVVIAHESVCKGVVN